jgi:hypothetical protein
MMMEFNQHDIVVWHAHTGDITCRVLHVYNEEPKTLLLTTNIDDSEGLGSCFHAPQTDCVFVRTGVDVTASTRERGRSRKKFLPQNLIKTIIAREDV